MLTDPATSPASAHGPRGSFRSSPVATQKVAIVNGSPQLLALVETVLSAGHYDVVFIESVAHAYSHIKRVQPNLVILCVRLDDMDTLQVLSMLKLDEDTRRIPVLTCTADDEQPVDKEDAANPAALHLFSPSPGVRMN